MTETQPPMTREELDMARATLAGIDQCTARIVAGFASRNTLSKTELPEVIEIVRSALLKPHLPDEPALAEPEIKYEPATPAQIKQSIRPDALISFFDGKPYKMLKRHLSTYGFDPASYRNAFGLPRDYPMVAPSYSEARSRLAKDLGLGRRSGPRIADAA